jgi:hypothetical protein
MQPPWRVYLVSALVACVVAAAMTFVTMHLIVLAGERPANPTPSALGAPPDAAQELKWTRPVAEDFLNALRQGNREAGANLITKGFAARLRGGDTNPTPLPILLGNVWIGTVWGQYGGESDFYAKIASYEIRDGTLAPDRREAAFEGVLKMRDGKEFKFRVRVIPEGEGGRWRIDSVVVTT